MENKEKEKIIKKYFDMWISRDFTGLDKIFTKDINYRECYGPIYCSFSEIEQWIEIMLAKQIVREWSIHNFYHSGDYVIVDWFFKADEDKTIYFDGVSLIEFQKDQIKCIAEYQSDHDTYRPFAPKE